MSSQYAAHRTLTVVVGSAAALLSVLPGVVVFSKGLYAPPGHAELFGTIITVAGTLAVLLLTLYRDAIARLTRAQAVRSTLALAAFALLALAGFAYARSRAVCAGPEDREIYVLVIRPPRVSEAGRQSEGVCRAVVTPTGANAVLNEVQESPGLVIASNAILLSLYIAMNVSVVAALAIAGWRAAADTGGGGQNDLQLAADDDRGHGGDPEQSPIGDG